MAHVCVVVTLAVCCLVTGSSVTDMGPVSATRECSVERSGVLTMFNGQTSTVAVPCKYRLADIKCGDYRLVVTPGSKLDSDNTFSPDTVLVNIKGLKENLFVRTTARRLQKFAENKVRNPWRVEKGNLNSFGLDLADYDSAKQAAVLRKNSVFEVEFSADQASVVVRCFSDSFSSKSQPDTLCGDGEPGTSTTRDKILDMVFSNKDVGQRLRPACPRAVSVYQQCAAANASDIRVCDNIFLDKSTVDCLAGSDTPLIAHYRRCLETACNMDNSARDPTIRYIDNNCALDPGSDCSTATFVGCDSNSTCEGGAICKRKLSQTCAGFSDHCVNGATCDPDTNICVTEDSSPCGDYEFQCQDGGRCLPYYYTCDGIKDCDDSSDEALEWCPPPGECSGPHKFQCDNGICKVIDFRCDDYDDCGDASDEKNCLGYECFPNDWQCKSGICIDKYYVCDGDEDCDDGSDELPENCPDTQPPHACAGFSDHCMNGTTCYPDTNLCTAVNTPPEECSDAHRFQCDSGECIPIGFRCDGGYNCADDSDEKHCPEYQCLHSDWRCADEKCVRKDFVCDGKEDCADGSVERNCLDYECFSDYWKCTDGICVMKAYVCDDIEDCTDGSDELPENCP